MTKPKVLSIDQIQIDAGTQSRLAINDDAVADYADIISESNGKWPFPPIDVFHDGSGEYYLVGDGFHRVIGAERAKRASIPCIIHKGTATDAHIFGMTANDKHGLRMTRADKRSCVEWLLDNGGKMTQADIADKAGVSKRLVQMTVAERKAQKAQVARPSGGADTNTTRGDGASGGKQKPDSSSLPPTSCEPETAQPPPNTVPFETDGIHPDDTGEVEPDSFDGPPDVDWENPNASDIATAKSKLVKTIEAGQRAVDDLNRLKKDAKRHYVVLDELTKALAGAKKWGKPTE